ncbi:MAG: c-type cytochrome [Planctomycetes bacterium]|nr:c-type cytochrome [Planctomycetota bacterium]
MILALAIALAQSESAGRDTYLRRCAWCHGDTGRGDGASAAGMFPRPRDFVRADYRIRSTPHGRLPTDEDLARAIEKGLPGTPMPAWEKILSRDEIAQLVRYLKSLSPRFADERPTPIAVPSGPGSAERGRELYRKARCTLCHGDAGRGDGGIATTLYYEWGLSPPARNLTRGWTFKGGHDPRDLYLRITGGLNGTPMGPYADLLTDRERWDLAHYVASLDVEPSETTEDFVVTATYIDGEVPSGHDAPEWGKTRPITIPLGAQVIRDAPIRWWSPTAGSVTLRALWNGREIAFLVEWGDPTGRGYADSAFLQFPAEAGTKPYLLHGDEDESVLRWHWQSDLAPVEPMGFSVHPFWKEGRRHVVFRRSASGTPGFRPDEFIPLLVSVRDGSNGERGDRRALTTWIYVRPEPRKTFNPWLEALACFLGVVLLQVWILKKVRS